MAQDGALGAAVARFHRDITGFTPEPPVTTVVLIRLKTGVVVVRLQIGEFACQPLPVPYTVRSASPFRPWPSS